jgi:hypothetical protein
VLDYLIAALDLPPSGSRVYEIGGADTVTYGDLMREYASQRGLRRHMIPVPLLTPRISGLWLSLVTPLYAQIGRKLVDGVQNQTVVCDQAALRDFPIRPRGVRDAIARSIQFEDRAFAETRWSDAGASEARPHMTLCRDSSTTAPSGCRPHLSARFGPSAGSAAPPAGTP